MAGDDGDGVNRATYLLLAGLSCGPTLGCDSDKPSGAAPSSSGPSSIQLVAVPEGDEAISAILQRESARAQRDGRDLLLYVGAPWCEPCTRFHDAAAAGKLDARFPTLRLLEFDRDRDEARLEAAGCLSKLIPLFARPTADGRCSPDKRMMGSIKGPGAIDNIAPRLERLLSQ